jgi:hypothetical protein
LGAVGTGAQVFQQHVARYRRGVGVQHQQGVQHRQVQEVQGVGGGLDRLPGLGPGRQRGDGPGRRLGQVGPAFEQPDQALVGQVGQPDAERHAGPT